MDELPHQITDPQRLFNSPIWQRCYVDFLRAKYAKRRKASTINIYANVLGRFFVDPKKPPDRYSAHDVEVFIRSGNPKPNTQNNRLIPLESFYEFARKYSVEFREKLVPLFDKIDPTENVDRVEASTERRAFEPHEIRLFFEAAKRETVRDKRDFALFLCYFSTGRRLSEIKNMQWQDLQEDNTVTSGISYRWQGKGRIEKERFAEMQRVVWDAIMDYLVASRRFEKMQPDSAVFVSQESQWAQRPMSSFQISRRFNRIASAAGLRTATVRDLTTHSWRYTYAIELYEENGYNLVKVQEDLGHTDPKVTVRYLGKRKKSKANPAPALILKRYGF